MRHQLYIFVFTFLFTFSQSQNKLSDNKNSDTLITKHPICILPEYNIIKEKEVYFDKNSTKLGISSIEILKSIAERIKDNNLRISIEGHVDFSEKSNIPYLSLKRANYIRKYLISLGIDKKQLTISDKEKNVLKFPECNSSSKCPEWKNLENRRVTFKEIE